MAEMTPADIAAVTGGQNQNDFDEIVLLIIMMMMFGGNGWNRNNNGSVTQMELQQGFDTQNIVGKLDRLGDGLSSLGYAQLQGLSGLQRDLCTGFSAVSSGIAENRFAAQQCCCDTNRNIDAVRYENARNTCDIVRAIEKDGDATRALINANVTQALRDKVIEQNQMIQSRDYQLSQLNQNAYLIGKLQPTPQPAYITCSPYESSFFANRGYGYGYGGYNNGCGGCCGNFA